MKERVAAFFDVDGTLIPSVSTERVFVFYLLKRRVIGWRAGWHFLSYLVTHPGEWQDSILQRNKAYLEGLKIRDLRKYARDCFEEKIRDLLSEKGERLLQKHKREGKKIVLLTGSLEFLIAPLADSLGVDSMLTSRLRLNKGIVSGEIEGLHPFGEKKRVLLEEYARRNGVDLLESYGYANSYQDIVFLEGVGNPVAVNPDRKLKEYAKHRKWPVLEF